MDFTLGDDDSSSSIWPLKKTTPALTATFEARRWLNLGNRGESDALLEFWISECAWLDARPD